MTTPRRAVKAARRRRPVQTGTQSGHAHPSPARNFPAHRVEPPAPVPRVILYRILFTLALPVLLARLVWRWLGGRESQRSVAERLGGGPVREGEAPLLWLHGASNGELASARGLLSDIAGRMPALRILVTANTETGRALAEGWAVPGLSAALAPLDHPLVLRRFLRRWRPGALVVIENEFWPERMASCAARGIPVLALGARMSERSARRWRQVPWLTRPLISALTWLSAQDAGSEARFRALGLDTARIGPVMILKAAVAPEVPQAELDRLAPAFPRATTILAASTHPGEEEIVLAAFTTARAENPALRLILAPRHPRRGPEVAALIRAAELGFATRSAGEEPRRDQPVWLADTMGDMPLWYALAGITFVGGSLVPKGGHTPFEPAALRSAIITGPDVSNAAPAYAALEAAAAVRVVRTAEELAAAILILTDPEAGRAQADAAARALAALNGGTEGATAFRAALADATGWRFRAG